jgi:hypothetical protein
MRVTMKAIVYDKEGECVLRGRGLRVRRKTNMCDEEEEYLQYMKVKAEEFALEGKGNV